ncbi:MAG: aminotransferase class V-fold PLP-dependent enzyme [Thiolinea sp.]
MSGFDAQAIRRDFPLFAAQQEPLHYLDNGATAQIHAAALAAIQQHELTARGNVMRGNHRLAERATLAYEAARSRVAAFLNAAQADEVIFTGGTTAAINLLAAALGPQLGAGDEIVVSLAEHHSNFLPWQALQDRGVLLRILPVRADGRLELEALSGLLTTRTRLLALTHASNVTGAITDVPAVVHAARQVGALVLLDGAQRVQHGPVDVQALGCDFYAFSGHKCFGPTGIGVLWGRREALAELPPFMRGGGMVGQVGVAQSTWAAVPRRFEAGTPPIAQAVGLGAALEAIQALDWAAIRAHETALLQQLLADLQTLPGLRCAGTARHPAAPASGVVCVRAGRSASA